MEKFEHAHPVTIFFNLGSVFYLIIIPVLRGFLSALQGGFTRWLSGAWADILVFLFMLGVAVTAWYCRRFRYDDKQIELRTGILNCRATFIPWDAVTTLTLVEPFFLRPIRALRFRADTLGGSFKNADFSIFLTQKQADMILKSRKRFSGESLDKIYHPTTGSIVALSLLSSNSFAGILFISAFVSQSGKLLGNEFSQVIIGTFEEAARNLAFGIPPAAAALAYILIAGWFISFFLTFIRYKDFSLTRNKNTLSINGGIFTHREYYIRYSDINFIDMRQSIFTKLLRLNSLYVSAVGYGKQKDDISCIVPTEREVKFKESCNKIFPHMPSSQRTFMPVKKGIMRFISPAVTAILGITAVMLLFSRIFPSWNPFIRFVGFMAFIPALFFLLIRIIDFRTGGLAFERGNYTLRYSSGWSLHTVVIPEDKVVRVELKQSLLQKFGGRCDLIISARAEGASLHRCRNLVMADMMTLFQIAT